MSQSKLSVKVSEKSSGSKKYWQGTVSGLQGTASFKIAKSDGSTQFGSASGVRTAAQKLASRIGYTVDFGDTKSTTKMAAKKTAKTSKTTSNTGRSSNPCSF